MVHRYRENRFSAFIKCAELQKRCKGLTFSSFLILPVQRVPRYGLLIKEVMGLCADGEGKVLLSKTLELTRIVATEINTRIAVEERRNRLVELQNMLGVEILGPARELVREGPLIKVCSWGKKEFYFILCTDMLIYASESVGLFTGGQKKYSVNKTYSLDELLFVTSSDCRTISETRCFLICTADKCKHINYIFSLMFVQFIKNTCAKQLSYLFFKLR